MTGTEQRPVSAAHSGAAALTVAIYVRSARTEDARRLPARAAQLQAMAGRWGWTVNAVILETRPRTISDQMLDALTGYDVVLIDGLSQLTRSLSHCMGVLERLVSADVRVVTGTADAAVGSMTGQGMTGAVRILTATVAEADRETHSRRIKAGMAAARARQGERR